MKSKFTLVTTRWFEDQALKLPAPVKKQLAKKLEQLAADTRYPSPGTHEIEGSAGDFGGKIFEAYISMQYRMTWEYGPKKGEITLRNVDNHDECLENP